MGQLLSIFDGMLAVKREFEDIKAAVDNIAIVAGLLLAVPLSAASSYKNVDWDYVHLMTEHCGYGDDSVWGYSQVLTRMKDTTATACACILMILIGCAMLHTTLIASTVDRYRKEANIFITYLCILLGIAIFQSVWVVQFFLDLFMMDQADYCKGHDFFG